MNVGPLKNPTMKGAKFVVKFLSLTFCNKSPSQVILNGYNKNAHENLLFFQLPNVSGGNIST